MVDKDYLEEWRDKYSYPEYIISRILLSEATDGELMTQLNLISGSAVGTSKNSYLDPTPLKNKLEQIYSNIIDSAFKSARTDAIKMNRINMDYTCGSNVDGNPEYYEYFRFRDADIQGEDFLSERKNGGLPRLDESRIRDGLLNGDIYPDSYNRVVYYTNVLRQEAQRLYNDYNITSIEEQEKYWVTVQIVKTEINNDEKETIETVGYIPSKKYTTLWAEYVSRNTTQKGLQLLMPQYKRRVEVEDLNENFWVIGQILDAAVNALWGPYGLIDVVRQLILKVKQLDEKNNILDIELLHNDSDDLYFDMYSRFTLPGLQLKLKTESGERIIKDIFKKHDDKNDRNSTTNGLKTVEELFEEITEEMYSTTIGNDIDGNGTVDSNTQEDLWPMVDTKKYTGLYDSDLIRSKGAFEVTNKDEDAGKYDKGTGKYYASLSTVIDAINDKIVGDENYFSGYNYTRKPIDKEFFEKFDPTIGDGMFSIEDYNTLRTDIETNFSKTLISTEQAKRFQTYQSVYDLLVSQDNEKIPESFKNKEIDKLFKDVTCLVSLTNENIEKLSTDFFNDELQKIYSHLGSYFGTTDYVEQEYFPDIVDILYQQYSSILSVCEYNVLNNNTKYTIVSLPKQKISYSTEGKEELEVLKDISPQSLINYVNYVNSGIKATTITSGTTTMLKRTFDSRLRTIHRDLTFNYTLAKNEEIISSETEQDFTIVDINRFISDFLSYLNITLKGGKTETTISLESFNQQLINYMSLSEQEIVSNLISLTFEIGGGDKLFTSTCNFPLYSGTSRFLSFLATQNSTSIDLSQFFIDIPKDIVYLLKGDYELMTLPGRQNFLEKIGILSKENQITEINLVYDKCYNFKEVTISGISSFSQDTIPVYSLRAASQIAENLASNPNPFENKDPVFLNFLNTFFDINTSDDGITIRDAAAISSLAKRNDSAYLQKMIGIDEILEKNYEDYKKYLDAVNFTVNEKNPVNDFRTKYFMYIDNPFKNINYLLSVKIPTQEFLTILNSMDGYFKEGIDWSSEEQKTALLKSIKTQEYGLYDNILVYLFDEDYYSLRYDSTNSSNYPSLYVRSTDIFFNSIVNPLIPGGVFQDRNIPLFVPRSDLRNGEIIEIKLNGLQGNHKVFDFEQGVKYVLNNSTYPSLKHDEETKLTLKLHNSFADNIYQYNYRTALFFKDTSIDTTEKICSLNECFNQGLYVQYFKPTRTTEKDIENFTQTITTAQLLKKNLRIYASMLASKSEYLDSSYELNANYGKLPAEENSNGDYANNIGTKPSSCYIFERQQAYSAAIRNNLIFYASPSTNEYGHFIHSPLMILESPNKFTPSETIQTALTSSRGILELGDEDKVSIPYDVMGEKDDTCTLTGIKDMLYRNAYENKKPQTIEVCWGRRNVDNYIKTKKLTHIVIEREKGERHKTHAPTSAGISISEGYLHSQNGIKSIYEGTHYEHKITWCDKNGEAVDGNIATAVYGVIDLTNIGEEELYGSNFLIRFYNSDTSQSSWTKEEFTITVEGKPYVRRPIIKRVYFFGESNSGTQGELDTQ